MCVCVLTQVVEHAGDILEKPADADMARTMLSRYVCVYVCVCVCVCARARALPLFT